MTNPKQAAANSRQLPTGWPVGSFNTYAEAQTAVDNLSDREFPVEKLTIVGVDLMQVENITGRLTWGRVLGGGALSGAWMGLFIGLIFALFAMPGTGWAVFFWSLLIGALFGVVFAAIAYGFSGGKRDFASATTIVAGRYDVLCEPELAPQARDMIAGGRVNEQTQSPQ
ncbi:magnesium transporter [Corynebacterium sp. TA-R-1]|uniref:Magnesium transporter n=1 Tax=Corynebacterium stercoris TaxID=2943490 RepID=A0ABT1G308_9CORY|nr:general stress protein [Corynebacterium stercoris]MCP1387378.1 magnesium transporter [Corynebacterium stercoris]